MKKLSLQVKITLLCMSILVISCVLLGYASIKVSQAGVSNITTMASEVTGKVFDQIIVSSSNHVDFSSESSILMKESEFSPLRYSLMQPLLIDSSVVYTAPEEIQVAFLTTKSTTQGKIQSTIIASMVFIVLIGCIMIYYLVKRMVHPIYQIGETIGRIDETDLSKRIVSSDSPETVHLQDSFNTMLERLEEAFERQKRFTSDAAHELKTPLASIQINLDSIGQDDDLSLSEAKEVLEVTRRNVQRLSSLTEDLLQLNRMQIVRKTEACSLKDCVDEIVAELSPFLIQKEVKVKRNTEEMMIEEDSQMLYRLLYNLIHNAVKYCPNESEIRIHWDHKVFTIENASTPISEDQIKQLFNPFYRIEESRDRLKGGSGLGLAICQEIVKKMNKEISASYQNGIFKIEVKLN